MKHYINDITEVSDITYMSELTLDIFDVKGSIRPAAFLQNERGGTH